MICHNCGIEAPTKHVEFHQNIGALIMRFSKTVEGKFCKSCIHSKFWEMTMITLVAGPWGIISLVVSPIFILNNLFRYLFCMSMEPVPIKAIKPQLNDEVVSRLQPLTSAIVSKINAGEDLEGIAGQIATASGTTPGEAYLYIRALIMASQKR